MNHSNPIANSDPNGDYSKIGAMWRNFVNDGNGIRKDNRTGEWGYLPNGCTKYKYHDPKMEQVSGTRDDYNKKLYKDWLENEKAANLEDIVFSNGDARHKRQYQHKDPPPGVDPNAKMNSRQRVGAILDMMSPALLASNAPQLKIKTTPTQKLPINVFSSKAPKQVTPGIKTLTGQYIDDLGRVQPWKARYDQFGRLIERTDWNAANKSQGIDAIHHHIYKYLPKGQVKSIDHIPGVGPTTGR